MSKEETHAKAKIIVVTKDGIEMTVPITGPWSLEMASGVGMVTTFSLKGTIDTPGSKLMLLMVETDLDPPVFLPPEPEELDEDGLPISRAVPIGESTTWKETLESVDVDATVFGDINKAYLTHGALYVKGEKHL